MSRLNWDWPAVRAAVDARMGELRLSTAELARRTRMSETTIRAFRKGRSRPYCLTVIVLNEGLALPRGYLRAIAEGRAPDPPLITSSARLARLEEKVDHLISLVRNDPRDLNRTGKPGEYCGLTGAEDLRHRFPVAKIFS